MFKDSEPRGSPQPAIVGVGRAERKKTANKMSKRLNFLVFDAVVDESDAIMVLPFIVFVVLALVVPNVLLEVEAERVRQQ